MNNVHLIIINYNSTKSVINCLESIDGTSIQMGITVIDNASKDRPEMIVNAFPKVHLIRNEKNLGFSRAANIGIKNASSELVVLLNPDTIIIEGFFEKVQDFLSGHPKAGVVGPKIYDSDGKIQGSARKFPTLWTAFFGRRSPLTKFFPNNFISKREFLCFGNKSDKELEVDWVSGACMVLNRDAVMKIGGFDERFFLFWEDTDLCKRMKDSGYKVLYYPKAQIVHTVGQSRATRPFLSTVHFHYSCFKLVAKYTNHYYRLFVPAVFLALAARCFLSFIPLAIYSIYEIPRAKVRYFSP